MNERILELAEEAGLNMWVNGNNEVEFSENEKRFAELIVKECVETLRLVPYNSLSIEFDEEIPYQEAIRKHFGVEE